MESYSRTNRIYRQLSDLELMRLQERILMNCFELNDINAEDRQILSGISEELFRRGLEKKRQENLAANWCSKRA